MPTYEYACKSCGEHLEVVQSFQDDALTTCPACAGPLRKVFGNIGIAFKGSGFYKNDSRSKSSSAAPSGGGSSDKGESSDKGSGDSAAASTSSDNGSSGSSDKNGSSGSSDKSGSSGSSEKSSVPTKPAAAASAS